METVVPPSSTCQCQPVGNQVPRHSGFKAGLLMESDRFIELSSSVASITNAWCYALCEPQQNNSQLAHKLGLLFSPRECVQLLVEFGTDTRSIPTVYAWHKNGQAVKSNTQQFYYQLKTRSASAISPLRKPAETPSLTVKSAASLFFYKYL